MTSTSKQRLARVYRTGAGVFGFVLAVYGVVGFVQQVPLTAHRGEPVLGMPTTGLLAGISVVTGLILLFAAFLKPAIASTVDVAIGILFLLSGLINICVLRTSLEVLGFDMRNVIFSFVVGLGLMTCGFYGRVSGSLPPDNPNWRRRHGLPEEPREGEDLGRTGYPGGGTEPSRDLDAIAGQKE
ncbi:DUF4383 domain-containing protein [Fodinicola acaciae]|uniref:DUF4383 domain-containing protein n=1 Tax=Fodinicola acaciae TaxID=2681555 RepID=UPI0013CF9CF0|nr:DUF4383 domain-containing protein [Fodinicola acaciae]